MENPQQELHPGTVLHGDQYVYKIKKKLGQGAFGITYLATTEISGKFGRLPVKVALKEYFARDLNSRTPDGAVRESTSESLAGRYGRAFQREAVNLSHLEHPGIVSVLEAFAANNTWYYAMEYIEGGSLDEYIAGRGGLPEPEALAGIREIGAALEYMHNHKMLHLDLKPKNIMRCEDGRLVLIDFGLSKQYDANGEMESSTNIGLGTPGYAPLEQSQMGSGKFFSPALDVYALSATLYKMLTGKTPPTSSEVFNLGFPAKDLRDLNVSERTISSIEAGMTPQQRQRPQTVVEFLGLLDDQPAVGQQEDEDTVLVKKPSSSEPPSSVAAVTPASPQKSSSRSLWIVLASCVVVAALVLLLWPGKKKEPQSLPMQQVDTVFTEQPAQESAQPRQPATQKAVPEVPQTGSARINSTPSGAQIWLDGKNTGKVTPEILEDLKAGSHKLVLKLAGYEDKSSTLSVKADVRAESSQTLTQKPQPAPAPQSQSVAQTSPSPSRDSDAIVSRNGNRTTYTVNGVSFTMVSVAGGTFTMGATSEQVSDADADEKPSHDVTLNGFSIGQTEVTQGLWEAVMGSNPSSFKKGENYPVEQVSYWDCKSFISKLNSLTGKNFRLPTEAEWEYAARGGRHSQGYKYSGSNSPGSVAWYSDNSGKTTHPVATKAANELGLYDMSGNVWEWCNDWYGDYSAAEQTNPRGPGSGSYRVYRGGSWYSDAGNCRASYRRRSTPSRRSNILGFRLAL